MLNDFLLQINKPGRYIGSEWNVSTKDFSASDVKFAICFPDLYEVGMSNLGIRIIYGLLNNMPGVCCERFFSCAQDMQEQLRSRNMQVTSLESQRRMSEFDIVGFSLGSELCFTNVLGLLELGALPLEAQMRDEKFPLVVGGGPAALNPEPMHCFFDLFLVGEAEEAIPELINVYRLHKEEYRSGRLAKSDLLLELSSIQGVYVPSLYEVSYQPGGKISSVKPRSEAAPARVKKRIVKDLNSSYFPVQWVVPFIQIVHDRITLEIARGCPNRCRFCQARSQYFPYRVRSLDSVIALAGQAFQFTGYEEISFCGLSVSDHPDIQLILEQLLAKFAGLGISMSLPSIKAKTLVGEMAKLISTIKKTGLTFAPEAGTQKLRGILGKDFDEVEFFSALRQAYVSGYQHVKLYFMLGLPYEEAADLDGIVEFSRRVSDERRSISGLGAGRVNLSINTFIPKPHTPLQWCRMIPLEEIVKKQEYLRSKIRNKKLCVNFHEARAGLIEAVLSRGDRRLSEVIMLAFRSGAAFDAWGDHFAFDKWLGAFGQAGIDPEFYLRPKDLDEILPWDHIDTGVDKEILKAEFSRSRQS